MAKRTAPRRKVKISEPPMATMADIYGTDARKLVKEDGQELNLSYVEWADMGRLWRVNRAYVYLGSVRFEVTDWRESRLTKIRHIFPVTYEPPPLPPDEIPENTGDTRPLWKQLFFKR